MPRFASLSSRRQRRLAKARATSKKARQNASPEDVASKGPVAVPPPPSVNPVAGMSPPEAVEIAHPAPQHHPGVLRARAHTHLHGSGRRPRPQPPLSQLPFPFHISPSNPASMAEQPFTGSSNEQPPHRIPVHPSASPQFTNPGPSNIPHPGHQQYLAPPVDHHRAVRGQMGGNLQAATQPRPFLPINPTGIPATRFNSQPEQDARSSGSVTPRPGDFNRQDNNVLMRDATPVPGIEVYRILRIAGTVRELYTAMDHLREALEDTFGRF